MSTEQPRWRSRAELVRLVKSHAADMDLLCELVTADVKRLCEEGRRVDEHRELARAATRVARELRLLPRLIDRAHRERRSGR